MRYSYTLGRHFLLYTTADASGRDQAVQTRRSYPPPILLVLLLLHHHHSSSTSSSFAGRRSSFTRNTQGWPPSSQPLSLFHPEGFLFYSIHACRERKLSGGGKLKNEEEEKTGFFSPLKTESRTGKGKDTYTHFCGRAEQAGSNAHDGFHQDQDQYQYQYHHCHHCHCHCQLSIVIIIMYAIIIMYDHKSNITGVREEEEGPKERKAK